LRERLAARRDFPGGDFPGAAGTATADEVAAALDRLERRSLVLTLDRRSLALGLRGPLPVLPGLREFPGGMVEEGARQWA
jgi:8-oxo-dGTP pyrophosphatase MutT (NUDIX family)